MTIDLSSLKTTPMKKTLFAVGALLTLSFGTAKGQSITINNTTGCNIKVTLYANDAIYSGCGTIISKPITLVPTASASYTDVADVNSPGCGGSGVGWFIPSVTYCASNPGSWDGAHID